MKHPAMIRAVKKLKARSSPSTIFFCLSNSNSVFIATILKVKLLKLLLFNGSAQFAQSKGLQDLFEEIVTNPAEWDPSGLLNLRRRVDPNGTQHQCKVGCSPNMCKGQTEHDEKFYFINEVRIRRRAGSLLETPWTRVRSCDLRWRRNKRFLPDIAV